MLRIAATSVSNSAVDVNRCTVIRTPERTEDLAFLHGQSRTLNAGGSTPSARR